MDAYRIRDTNGNSLDCRQIEYAVKKFRGHRKIPLRILESCKTKKIHISPRSFCYALNFHINCAQILSNKFETTVDLRCPLLYIAVFSSQPPCVIV